MTPAKNLLEPLPEPSLEEVVTVLVANDHARIERIVSFGQSSPDAFWYDQAESEWVLVLQGWGTIEFENGATQTLRTGDYLFLPAHQKHRVLATASDEPTVWLAIFIP